MLMSTEKILETERTFLTILTEEDLPAMAEMAREPDTFKYIRKLRIMTEQEYAQFLLAKLEQIRNKTGFHWAVWLKTDSTKTGREFPGDRPPTPTPNDRATTTSGNRTSGDRMPAAPTFIGAVNLNPVAGTPMMQIGCQLKRAFWRQGFASELIKRIQDFALNEAGLKTVYGVFEKDNDASRRLMEKLDFVWQETKQEAHGVVIEIHKYPAQ